MGRLALSLLGAFQATLDGIPLRGFESNKVRALLAYLAVEAGRPHSREALATLLWPDHAQQAAMTYLRIALADLRQLLGDRQAGTPFLLVSHDSLQFNPASNYWLDVKEFDELVASDQVERFNRAVELFKSEFLEGFSVNDSASFEEWASLEREKLHRQVMQILHRLAECNLSCGEYGKAEQYAHRQVELEPWLEEAHRQLMLAQALGNRRSAALAQYNACSKLLMEELGVEPSSDTTRLYEQIRSGEIGPPLAGQDLLPGAFTRRQNHNLPATLNSFIGRRREIAQVKKLLKLHRLVTLTGAGGVGKTRLALQVARQLTGQFTDGVWLVELAPLADPNLLVQAVAEVLGYQLAADAKALDMLAYLLQPKHLLLLLDNCEHLVEACANLADALLRACPDLRIMTTSREQLSIDGEALLRVPSLSLPDADDPPALKSLPRYEAVRLFMTRAATASPGFSLTPGNTAPVSQVCNRLDGIPLAIELAATRVKTLQVEEIALQLDNCFRLLTGGSRVALPRLQTMQASIAWSYELLSPAERLLLQRLSVFAGSWSEAAAEAVGSGDGLAVGEVLDLLGGLLSKSMITVLESPGSQRRYRMLEMIRQFAQARLDEAGKTRMARDRHLEYYCELAEKIEFDFVGPKQAASSEKMETELDNIRLALGWSLENKSSADWDPEPGLRLASTLGDFWNLSGRIDEGFGYLEQLLISEAERRGDQPVSSHRAYWRAKALQVAGYLAIWLRDYDKVVSMSEESRDLFHELGPQGRRGYALALENLAWLASGGAYNLPMESLLAEASAIFKEVGDPIQENECRFCSGIKALLNNDLELAKTCFEEVLTFFKEIGMQASEANLLRFMAEIALAQGEVEKARAFYDESRVLCLQSNHIEIYLDTLMGLGRMEQFQGKIKQAAETVQAALDLARQQGNFRLIWETGANLGNLALLQGDYARAAGLFAQNLEFYRQHTHPTYVAFSLRDMGHLEWETGDYHSAERRFDEMSALLSNIGSNEFEQDARFGAGRVALAQGELVRARESLLAALELRKVLYPRYFPDSLEVLASVEAAQDQYVSAARLLGATEDWHQASLNFRTPRERKERDAAILRVREALGEAAFAAAWEAGKALSPEQAAEYVLEHR